MLGTAFSKNNIILLLVIAIVGIGLAIISYQYSTITASEIAEIAAQDVKSNANIEVYELARILVRSIDAKIIQKVLAGPCGLGNIGLEEASVLFEDLKKG